MKIFYYLAFIAVNILNSLTAYPPEWGFYSRAIFIALAILGFFDFLTKTRKRYRKPLIFTTVIFTGLSTYFPQSLIANIASILAIISAITLIYLDVKNKVY